MKPYSNGYPDLPATGTDLHLCEVAEMWQVVSKEKNSRSVFSKHHIDQTYSQRHRLVFVLL